MYEVSEQYKSSMKQSLRNRSYMLVSLGLVNQEAQSNSTVKAGETAFFSTNDILADTTYTNLYVSLEQKYSKTDGSMIIPPEGNESVFLGGYASKHVMDGSGYELTVNLNIPAITLYGLTIKFGYVYPVKFDIITSDGTVFSVTNNNTSDFRTEHVFANTTSIAFKFYTMSEGSDRLRIYHILLGVGLVYGNESIIDSDLDNYLSLISEDIPQIDFSVTVKNYDKYFNPDNPNSAFNFFEAGQKISVSYGYDIDGTGNIEWVKAGYLDCSKWKADDKQATIYAQDTLRLKNNKYYRGKVESHTFYELAENVIKDMGIEDYYIDPYLKKITTTNPVKHIKHKQALQLISNASRSVFFQDRDGKIRIRSYHVPSYTLADNDHTAWSNLQNTNDDFEKDEYATLENQYDGVNGKMKILPENGTYNAYTGYVSNSISNASCTFMSNPMITVELDSALTFYFINFVFGNEMPAEFIIRTYRSGELQHEYTVNEIKKNLIVYHTYEEIDKFTVEFTKTENPYNRIVMNYISFINLYGFKMENQDLLSYPTVTNDEKVKDIIVNYYTYIPGDSVTSLTNEKSVAFTAGQAITYYYDNAASDYTATINGSAAAITESGPFFCTITPSVTGNYPLIISGKKYTVLKQQITVNLNPRGNVVTWDNPLVDTADNARLIGNWLAEYIGNPIMYEYDTRGNPELDTADVIKQEDSFNDGLFVKLYETKLKFNGAFSSHVKVRRTSV